MPKNPKLLTEQSRRPWPAPEKGEPTIPLLEFGALQRIATSMEKAAAAMESMAQSGAIIVLKIERLEHGLKQLEEGFEEAVAEARGERT